MTYLQIQDAVLDSLHFVSSEGRARVKNSINRRNREVTSSLGLPLARRTLTTAMTSSGDPEVTVSGAKVLGVYDQTNNRTLPEVTREEILRRETSYEDEGEPLMWAPDVLGAIVQTIRLNPTPDAEQTLHIDLFDSETDLTDDGDVPAWHADFHDILVHLVRYDELNRSEKMGALAQEAWNEGQRRLREYRYFIAKSAYARRQQTHGTALSSLSATVWPYSNLN